MNKLLKDLCVSENIGFVCNSDKALNQFRSNLQWNNYGVFALARNFKTF